MCRSSPSSSSVPHGRNEPVRCFTLLLCLAATLSCERFPHFTPGDTPGSLTPTDSSFVPTYGFEIVNTYPHDANAFTQGLVYQDSVLYEGTGLNGRSSLRKVALETGQVMQSVSIDGQFFGEGIALFGSEIVQLTWLTQVGFVYDLTTFEQKRTFSYPTEGWGITTDGHRYIMSDGTPILYFRDPQTLEEIGRIEVRDEDGPISRLNELEYINGEIFANVWLTDKIVRIEPVTGRVLGWIDLTGLLSPADRTGGEDVLNGIAWDDANDRLFVTGKLWPKLFEIRLTP
jgi:glutamine cyclotransferase